jgi:hypothetical protein
MAINGTATTRLEGIVASVNEKGLRLEGRDGWLNYSKWAGEISPPAHGQAVMVALDGAGFVRAVEPAAGTPPDAPESPVASRETASTRLAVLKAAAQFAASRPDLKSGDVLKIAASWERWILWTEEG